MNLKLKKSEILERLEVLKQNLNAVLALEQVKRFGGKVFEI